MVLKFFEGQFHRSKHTVYSLYLFIAALGVYLAFISALSPRWRNNQNADFRNFYYPLALNVMRGNGYTINGEFVTRYPPGYPLFLAMLLTTSRYAGISDENALFILCLLMAVLIPQLAFRMARDIVGDRAAFLGALVLSIYPLHLWMLKQPNSELPFTALLLILATALLRTITRPRKKWSAVYLGLVVGLMTLMRPIAILLGFVIAALTFILAKDWPKNQRAVFAGLLVGINLMVIAPWCIIATVKTKKLVVGSTGGVPALVDGLTYYYQESPTQERSFAPAGARALMHDIYGQQDNLKSLSDILTLLNQALRERPLALIQLVGLKVFRVWYGTDSQWLEKEILLIQIPFLTMLVWGLVLLLRGSPHERCYALVTSGIIFYFWAMSLTALSIVRYMVPAMALAAPAWGVVAQLFGTKLASLCKHRVVGRDSVQP